MEASSRNDEACPQLLDLIPRDREWLGNREHEQRSHGSSEERKLELRLAPPGVDWSVIASNKTRGGGRKDESLLSLGYFNGNGNQNQTHKAENPWGGPKVADQSAAEKKAFTISPAAPANTTAVPNTSQKRTAPAPAPVVGWPPIRSFRKNLATSSSSSKPAADPSPSKVPTVDKCKKGLFVKINMDGVPIGRKVDLKAYDSYEKLSVAVDELFRGLLAAQRDSCMQEEEKAISGVLDGSGEYTLVYEDNEGDRMLAGDVPWDMFVSTVKRLRVLKSSELSALSLGSKQHKITHDSA